MASDLLMVTGLSLRASHEGSANVFSSYSPRVMAVETKFVEVTHAGPSTNRSPLNACCRMSANTSVAIVGPSLSSGLVLVTSFSDKPLHRSSANAF